MDNIFEKFHPVKKDSLIFSYKGLYSQSVLVDAGQSLKDKLKELKVEASIVKVVFSVFIELAQNISKYAIDPAKDKSGGEERPGSISVSYENGIFTLVSGNLVNDEQIEIINSRLHEINIRDKSSLKAYYKNQRMVPVSKYAKGARLGLIDISIKAADKPIAEFHKIDEAHSFFLFTVKINDKKMTNLHISANKDTPEIKFNADTGELLIAGNSYPENPFKFYEESVKWIVDYIKMKKPIVLKFKLEYFNTSSSKQFLDIMEMLDEYFLCQGDAQVIWYYKEEDEEQKLNGSDFFEGFEMPTKLISF